MPKGGCAGLSVGLQQQAAQAVEVAAGGLVQRQSADALGRRVAQPLPDDSRALRVVQHPAGNGGRSMAQVGQHAYLAGTLDEGTVELLPRPSRERHDAHVTVGHQQPVGK